MKSSAFSASYMYSLISINDGKRFFERVKIDENIIAPGNEMIQIRQVFYSKDFALLGIYYDNENRTLKYKLFDACFGK